VSGGGRLVDWSGAIAAKGKGEEQNKAKNSEIKRKKDAQSNSSGTKREE